MKMDIALPILLFFVFLVIVFILIDRMLEVFKKKQYHDAIQHDRFMRTVDWIFNSFFEWRRWKKYLLVGTTIIIMVLGISISFIQFALPSVPPLPTININHQDSTLLKRGKYLVEHVAICTDCHSPRDVNSYSWPVIAGQEGAGGPFLSKKAGFDFPGESFTPNITPAGEIGKWTDAQLYRLLTTGIKADGNTINHAMPFEAFGKADPEDLKAIIVYLRTLRPIHNSPEGKTQIDYFYQLTNRLIPRTPKPIYKTELKNAVDSGRYLVMLAACNDCHTPKKWDDSFDTKRAFMGGIEFPMPTGGFVHSANLTPDESGIGDWNEDTFVNRFLSYRDSTAIYKVSTGAANSLMPWSAFRYMEEADLRRIYAYLRTLPPIHNPVVKFTKESYRLKKAREEER
ncbi:MAG: cytochrome c [Sphingobacterium sp.]|jgi:mono/diheme cytochrome c family protein|nr:cytochrome c [Sphingobacterium sp.]